MFLGWFSEAGPNELYSSKLMGGVEAEGVVLDQTPASRSPVGASLQGGGGQLLDAPLSEEGTLDGLELWSGLGVLQGGVGGCHRTLRTNKTTSTSRKRGCET